MVVVMFTFVSMQVGILRLQEAQPLSKFSKRVLRKITNDREL